MPISQTAVSKPSAIVIGAGLVGCAAAFHLARVGCKVTVLERHYFGRHASGATAAGVRVLNRHVAEIPIALAALEMWHRMPEIVGDDCGFVPSGQLRIAPNLAALAELDERDKLLRSLGFDHEHLVDTSEVAKLLPAAKPEAYVGGVFGKEEGYADPFRTIAAFERNARECGAHFHYQCAVERIEKTAHGWQVYANGLRFASAVVINASGAWAARLAQSAGEDVPSEAVALMMMVTERLPPMVGPVVGAVGKKLSLKQLRNGTIVIGGAHRGSCDLSSERSEINILRLRESAATVCEVFPTLHDAGIVRCWAGIEAFTPDHLPVVSWSESQEGLFHAYGFSAHGFAIAPYVGSLVAEAIVGRPVNPLIASFGLSRFTRTGVPAAAHLSKIAS
jgi:sarcosine oxidase subunit beta